MPTSVDITIPVYNEEIDLPACIARLTQFLQTNVTADWRVVIADNASTDGTQAVSQELCRQYPGVNYLYLPQKGRGRALRTAWLTSDADVVSYMDVDLSTDLAHFPELLSALDSGYQVAIGSRLSNASRVSRGFKREFVSRSYNLVIKGMFLTRFPDAQCGFKAMTREAAQAIVPLIQNNNWFFDTELLIIAARNGYPIKSVPVRWDDDLGSTVHIVSTATEDLKGLCRLRFGGVPKVAGPGPSGRV